MLESQAGRHLEVFLLPSCSLLGVGCDLNGQLYRLHESISSSLIYWFHRLNVNARHYQVVLRKHKAISHFSVVIKTKHRGTDDLGRVLKHKKGAVQ